MALVSMDFALSGGGGIKDSLLYTLIIAGSQVTSNATQQTGGHGPDKSVDGTFADGWVPLNLAAGTTSYEYYTQYDLLAPYKVRSILMTFANATAATDAVCTVEIQGSNSANSNYVSLYKSEPMSAINPWNAQTLGKDHSINILLDGEYRYYRVVINTTTFPYASGSKFPIGIGEIMFSVVYE